MCYFIHLVYIRHFYVWHSTRYKEINSFNARPARTVNCILQHACQWRHKYHSNHHCLRLYFVLLLHILHRRAVYQLHPLLAHISVSSIIISSFLSTAFCIQLEKYTTVLWSLPTVLWEPTDSVMEAYRQCYWSLPTVLWEPTRKFDFY
jgi:hypothetical protein